MLEESANGKDNRMDTQKEVSDLERWQGSSEGALAGEVCKESWAFDHLDWSPSRTSKALM